jgi:hypothetical protein
MAVAPLSSHNPTAARPRLDGAEHGVMLTLVGLPCLAALMVATK